jgi:hypothetical protein
MSTATLFWLDGDNAKPIEYRTMPAEKLLDLWRANRDNTIGRVAADEIVRRWLAGTLPCAS